MKKLTAEGKRMLAKMKAAGKQWAQEYLGSDDWVDWLDECLRPGRDSDPLPKEKKRALRLAKDVMVDTTNTLGRDLEDRDILSLPAVRPLIGSLDMADYHLGKEGVDYGEFVNAFRNAAHDVIHRKSTISWVADEIIFRATEG